jgi:hypothetical protein
LECVFFFVYTSGVRSRYKSLFRQDSETGSSDDENNSTKPKPKQETQTSGEQIWLQIMLDVNDYDLIKVNAYMKLNHQLCFAHIVMTGRRNQKINQEYAKMNKRKG